MDESQLEEWLRDGLARIEGSRAEKKMGELHDRLEGLEERGSFTLADVHKAVAAASPEERAAFRAALDDPPAEGGATPEGAAAAGPPPEEPAKPRTRKRPGRKSGGAYDWTIDEKGNVERLSTARVYNGPDEADEVILAEPEPEPAAAEA